MKTSATSENHFFIKIKRYRGRTSVVSARLPGDLVKELDRLVKRTGYNRNEIIEMCLEYAMESLTEERT